MLGGGAQSSPRQIRLALRRPSIVIRIFRILVIRDGTKAQHSDSAGLSQSCPGPSAQSVPCTGQPILQVLPSAANDQPAQSSPVQQGDFHADCALHQDPSATCVHSGSATGTSSQVGCPDSAGVKLGTSVTQEAKAEPSLECTSHQPEVRNAQETPVKASH